MIVDWYCQACKKRVGKTLDEVKAHLETTHEVAPKFKPIQMKLV